MQEGDLLSFDTDLIDPMGFYNDILRSWIVGEIKPGDQQRRLYEISRAQLETNRNQYLAAASRDGVCRLWCKGLQRLLTVFDMADRSSAVEWSHHPYCRS